MTDHKEEPGSVDDKREEVIALLSDGFARDALAMDEFERRVEAAHDADSVTALATLVKDLAPAPSKPPATTAAQKKALVPRGDRRLQGEQPATGFVMALWSGSERKGSWTVPKKMRAVAIMGGTDIDYREARFGPGIHELTVFACMGGVDIIVPPDVVVECNGMGILGGFDGAENLSPASAQDRPVLRISGLALMGGVGLQTRLPGESRRDARKRRKRELKEKRQRLLSD